MYHPDVLTSSDSSEEERRIASENFAKINAAYEMLSGGGAGAASAEKKTSSGGYNYQPPHRRSSSSYTTKSTNWEDYMPNYQQEDETYDAGGDSFGAIFSDLLTGVAAGAAGVKSGRGGIMNDLIEFLERNVDGFSSGYDDDTSLEQLLSSGSFEEVANEMDEIDVLVSSLEKKLSTVQDEVMQLEADLKYASKYSEKIDIEERIAELKAREKVVSGYLKKGRNRLLRLRERYKELIVQGKGGKGYDSAKTEPKTRGESYSDQAQSSSTAYKSSPSPSPSPSSRTSSSESNSWRTEGFGGSSRRSSSSRRSGRRRSNATRDNASTSTSEPPPNQQTQSEPKRTYTTSGNSSSTKASNRPSSPVLTGDWTPPHRRTQSSTQNVAEEKRRLRELKVDDEFEKLKREMGQM